MKKRIGLIIVAFIFGIIISFEIMYLFPNVLEWFNIGKNNGKIVIEDGISEGINNVYDSVVVVENYRGNILSGNGSGFIYNKDGYIITNQHVIDNSGEIKIILSDGNIVDGNIIGSDEYADIAVIKIDKSYVKSVAKLGSSKSSKLGDTVFAIGSPMSSDYFGTVTKGIISGKNRLVEIPLVSSSNDWIMEVIQTDAAINPGNSGGPLCNVNGEVIGVTTMKISENEIEGVGFSIPIEDAIECAKRILKNEKIEKTYIGITMADTDTSSFLLRRHNISVDENINKGVIVMEITENGPAYNAGIKKGDVIIKLGEYDIKNSAYLKYYLYKYKPNDEVQIELIRNSEILHYNVILEKGE